MTCSWSAKLSRNVAKIEFAESVYPSASFAHELLHIKLELDGLICPQFKDEEGIGGELIGWMFNQLCHHKMYPIFLSLGYSPEQFLNDSDPQEAIDLLGTDLPELEKLHQTNNTPLHGLPILLPYLVVNSPNENTVRIHQFRSRLLKISDPAFLTDIDRILREWIDTASLDSSPTFAKLFKACNRPRIGFCITGIDADLVIAGNVVL